ncbi:MAG: type II toxin-antitoxin system mRNA interferase toxin, RelE/StbE family [Microgenomates group bacterium]
MKIITHSIFKKNFKKRIEPNGNLVKRFKLRVKLFLTNRENPILRDHALIGKKLMLRAFSIAGDIRIVYKLEKQDLAIFLDIGSHNQVY